MSRWVKIIAGVCCGLVAMASQAYAESVQTEFGNWSYLRNESALETAEWLTLRAETEAGTEWLLSRRCVTNRGPVLQANAHAWGDAVDVDGIYLQSSGWFYNTRFRVDEEPVRGWRWRYRFDSDGRKEVLYNGPYVGSDADEHLLGGDRLVVEIGTTKGVVVFDTQGFAEALAKHC